MRQHLGLGSILGGTAIVLIATQPVGAVPTQVTAVQVNQTNGGMEVVLQTRNGERPQIFTVSRGNVLVADITNTQLSLPEGNGFLQNNPAPGISSVMVSALDANSVRVTVSGNGTAPASQVEQRGNGIVLNVNPSSGTEVAQQPGGQQPADQQPAPVTPPAPTTPVAPPAGQTPVPPVPQPPLVPAPDVLVPNPQISIDGVPAAAPQGVYVPPLAPRAIAPPLGDIAVSNIDVAPTVIDLDSSERVPRLVLRDAPVRDVLSLLARAAGLNVAYVGELPATEQQFQQQIPGQEGAQQEIRVSLDVENELVQDVFNYVLRISGVQANRTGRTIFVGPRLPEDARGIISRTFRLNQTTANDAANYLATQGAESRQFFQQRRIETFGEGAAARTVEVLEPPQIVAVRVDQGEGALLLRGLSVTTDVRLNAVTLVGTPRQIQVATGLLAQLDLRRRQVAVNVRVIDVNLLATEDFNTSFSFGVGDAFFTSDGGAASFNYGGVNPPSRAQFDGSQLSPPIIEAPFPEDVEDPEPFFDAQPDSPFGTGEPQPFGNPRLNDGTIQIPGGTFFRPPFGTDSNPLQGGVTRINPDDTIEVGLPELFQFPTRFLASLQAQVVSGNAKILTDPTLTVQEGQRAQVRLTTQVFGGFSADDEPIINDAGLTLDIVVDRIDDNGFVTLSVAPTVSAIANTFDTQQGDIVLLQERSVSSGLLRVRDGQTLILSGIIQEVDRATVSKIPILGDIPLLGALFRRTERENTRQEVIVLLTPQVLNDSDVSNFGYSYTPGREVQQFLQRRGVQFP